MCAARVWRVGKIIVLKWVFYFFVWVVATRWWPFQFVGAVDRLVANECLGLLLLVDVALGFDTIFGMFVVLDCGPVCLWRGIVVVFVGKVDVGSCCC